MFSPIVGSGCLDFWAILGLQEKSRPSAEELCQVKEHQFVFESSGADSFEIFSDISISDIFRFIEPIFRYLEISIF